VYTIVVEDFMKTVVQKWGNSLGIRIPSLYVKQFDLKGGSSVEIFEDNGKLVILPKKNTLEALLSQVKEDNKHTYVDTGSSLGKEEW
jgi:antitoxin MazE